MTLHTARSNGTRTQNFSSEVEFPTDISSWASYGLSGGNILTSQWRHNERDGVSNHRSFDCLLNRMLGCRSKKASKFCVIGLSEGPVTRKMFPFDDVINRHPFVGELWIVLVSILRDLYGATTNPRRASATKDWHVDDYSLAVMTSSDVNIFRWKLRSHGRHAAADKFRRRK